MFTATAIFLFVFFIAAEFYRFGRRITGSIREIRHMDGDPTGLMGVRLQVLTSEAGEVTAFVSGCQMCFSSIEIGGIVSLIPGPGGYVMKTPWTSRRRHKACAKRVAA
jgi:hypothetical protein